jgi:DNA-binding phage protein
MNGWHRLKWTTRFGKFLRMYGVPAIASDLGVSKSTLYHYLDGKVEPRRAMIQKIIIAAKARQFHLTLRDLNRHLELASTREVIQ